MILFLWAVMKILITTQVYIQNMGDYWTDQKLVAVAYADFIRLRWFKDLANLIESGHEISINCDVVDAYTGTYSPIDVLPENNETARLALAKLTHDDDLFSDFIDTPEAIKFCRYRLNH